MDVTHESFSGESIDQKALGILFLLPDELAAYGSSLGVSSLEPSLGFNGNPIISESEHIAVSGYAARDSLRIVAILTELQGGARGTIRIHEGYACDSAGEPMSSFSSDEDLWSAANFTADEFGNVEFNRLVESLPLSRVPPRPR
jgi:hypothetical protein